MPNWIRLLVPLMIILVFLVVALVVILWLARRRSSERAIAQTLESAAEEDPNRIVVPLAPPASVVEPPEPEELMLDQLAMADEEVEAVPEIEFASGDEEESDAEPAELVEDLPTEPAIAERDENTPEDAVSLVTEVGQATPVVEVDPVAEPAVLLADLSQSQPDDLRRIEGIGVKISQLLIESGLRTYADLAAAEIEVLRGLLRGARIGANPTTWPEQAALAAQGRWEELAMLQAELTGGRRA